MVLLKSVFVLFLIFQLSKGETTVQFQPEQVRLSLAGDGESFVVTWTTWNFTHARAKLGLDPFDLTEHLFGEVTPFEDNRDGEIRVQYIHTLTLKPLAHGQIHYYHVGSDLGWSDLFWFQAYPAADDTNWSPRVAMFGDLGNVNAQSLPRLQEETQSNMYDMVIHNGDFAYDMETENGRFADEFFRQIEPIAAYVPYMTSPGNHESYNNFSHYKGRFVMPNDVNNQMYYSFNLGPVHFISISTEYYYYLNYGEELVVHQYDWLVNDLKEATTENARSKRPWIIIFGHRPMYCSVRAGGDCLDNASTRVGLLIDGEYKYGLEPLLLDYNVDVAFWAHEHNYERIYPIYDYKFDNESSEPYTDPKFPIHITTGSAGCFERHDPFFPQPDLTAFRSNDYGYTKLTFHNSSHLEIEHLSDDQDGKIIDHLWIISYDHSFENSETKHQSNK